MKTINLLPKERQQELKYEAIYHSLLTVLWISVLSFAVVFGTQYFTTVLLQYQQRSISTDIVRLTADVNKQDNSGVRQKITAINNLVGDFLSLSGSNPHWSQLLKAFTPLVPDGVHVLTFTVDTKTDQVNITGFAPTRQQVILLHDNIAADTAHFTNIDYPLENVSKEANINFHYTFTVNKEVLQ